MMPLMTPSGRNRHWNTEWSAPPVVNTHWRSCDQCTLVTWAECPTNFLNLAPAHRQRERELEIQCVCVCVRERT